MAGSRDALEETPKCPKCNNVMVNICDVWTCGACYGQEILTWELPKRMSDEGYEIVWSDLSHRNIFRKTKGKK